MKNLDNDILQKITSEIEFLTAFWLTHICGMCNDDLRNRMPRSQFPNIYKFLSQVPEYKIISREDLFNRMKEHSN